jgi:signal transduction histidine kinase
MKLINKATRSFLIACLIASIAGGVLCYVILKKILEEEDTERLYIQKTKFEDFVKTNGKLPENDLPFLDRFWIYPIKNHLPVELKDTVLQTSPHRHGGLEIRQIAFCVKTADGYYQIKIRKALYESEDLIEALLAAFAGLMVLLVAMLFFANYRLSRSIWKPFYQTLDLLQTFKITQKESIIFEKSDISEFQTLQKNLFSLTEQVRREYQSLKSFTENASHEFQTQLAVIGSNLELLLQDNNLTESQMQQIGSLIESLGKLSKLNQTLLLLTKIENRQFEAARNLNLSEAIFEKLNLLDVWIQHKNLVVENHISPNISIQINEYLLDVLLNNLLGNAIKYNLIGGELDIELKERNLIIKNTGNPLIMPTEQLFERFQKDSSTSDSLGLGLALVKQICDTYGFRINYIYENGWHILSVVF